MATYVEDKITHVTITEMAAAFSVAWLREFPGKSLSRETLLLLLSAWSVETGEGAKMHLYNVGNVKSVEGDGHDFTFLDNVWEGLSPTVAMKLIASGEAVRSTNPNHIKAVGRDKIPVIFKKGHPQTRFRAFPTLDAGVERYLKLLQERWPKAWTAVEKGNPEDFVHQLAVNRYFSANEEAYTKEVRRRYDVYAKTLLAVPASAALTPAPEPAPAAPPAPPREEPSRPETPIPPAPPSSVEAAPPSVPPTREEVAPEPEKAPAAVQKAPGRVGMVGVVVAVVLALGAALGRILGLY